jgi:glycosyltransferase involved in cell wall biosynthesis
MKVLVISGMYPTKRDPLFGIYVKETVESLKKYYSISSKVIAPMTSGRGLITVVKYLVVLVRSMYRTFRGRFDIIHAHYVIPAGLIALIPKYLRGKKLVVTAHGSDINILPKRSRILWFLTRFVLRRADRIIAVSNPLRDIIIHDFGIDSKKVSVIPCGVDLELFRPMDKSLCREIVGLPRDKLVIFHLSTLDPVKRVDLVIESFELIHKGRDNTLLVIGGYGSHQNNIKQRVCQKGLEKCVIFLGYIPKNNVWLWLNAADIFVLTSESEGMPLTIMEAMATGTGIVSTNVGGIADAIKDFSTIVTGSSKESIAKAMIEALDKYSLRKKKASLTKSLEFGWETIAGGISRIYNGIP